MAKAMCIKENFHGPSGVFYRRNSGPHDIDPESSMAKFFEFLPEEKVDEPDAEGEENPEDD